MVGEAKHETKKSMVRQGKVGDGEVANEGNEGGTSEGIIHHTGTPTMGLASEQLKTVKAREAIQNHQARGFVELEEVTIVNR